MSPLHPIVHATSATFIATGLRINLEAPLTAGTREFVFLHHDGQDHPDSPLRCPLEAGEQRCESDARVTVPGGSTVWIRAENTGTADPDYAEVSWRAVLPYDGDGPDAGDTAGAMPQKNVEIVRPIYAAFNRRDWDALFRDTDPEFAFTYHNVGTSAGTRRGREEVVAFAEEYGGAFETLIWEPEEFFDREDRVVAVVSVRSRPRGGDVDLVVRGGHLWTVGGGVVLSLESFPTPERALEAAGLLE
jgi:ketosteroid isomerase-like protein